MSSALTLDEIYNDDDGFVMSAPKANKPFFEFGKAYPVTITEIVPKQTKNGYLQAEVALTLTGTDRKAGRQWLMLPAFSAAMAQSMDKEKLEALKQSFGKRFHGFLRAIDPTDYEIYSRLDKTGKSWTFYGSDGEPMTAKQKAAREREVAKLVVETARDIAAGGEATQTYVGASVYLVITQDKLDPKKTYTNWYSEVPENYELAEI